MKQINVNRKTTTSLEFSEDSVLGLQAVLGSYMHLTGERLAEIEKQKSSNLYDEKAEYYSERETAQELIKVLSGKVDDLDIPFS